MKTILPSNGYQPLWRLILAVVTLFYVLPIFGEAVGQDKAVPEKKLICIGPIIAIKSATEKVEKAGQIHNLQQTLETLDTTLIDQVNGSRKFEVVARKESLKTMLNEQEFAASGRVDPATAAQGFKLAGAQYVILTTITDFVMGDGDVKFESIGVAAKIEAVRISCSIQIYDTSTGRLIESARFRGQNATRAGGVTDQGASITKITDQLAAEILAKIVEVIYPAKVAAKAGSQITINRGEGAGVAVGQAWTVFALGDEIKDPDTGEGLGRNETEIGTIIITRVTPKLSYGDAADDKGIAIGNITRLKQSSESTRTQSPAPALTEEKPKNISDKVRGDL